MNNLAIPESKRILSILGATCGQRCLDYKQQEHHLRSPRVSPFRTAAVLIT